MGLLVFSNLNTAEHVQVYINPSPIPEQQSYTPHLNPHTLQRIEQYLVNDISSLYNVNIELIDNEYSVKVFTITIPSSIHDFWHSEAYELAIVIAVASLIWPYIKLIILLIVWLCDMHQNLRTKLILFIDQAGKWSYMDLYASVVMTVCFYVQTTFKFKDTNIDIRIVCEPDIGIVTFVIANLLSMGYSHIFIFWDQKYGYKHHVQVWTAQMESQHNSPCIDKRAMINAAHLRYSIKHDAVKQEITFKPIYKVSGVYDSFYRADIHLWRRDEQYNIFAFLYRPQSFYGVLGFSLYLLSLFAILWLIIEMVFTVPAVFDIEGVVGSIIGSPANHREFNPIQTANHLISSTDRYKSAMFLSICYWITIIVCPILTQLLLIVIWFIPTKHRYFVFWLKSIWFVQAWNALDVFVVGTISGSIEMNTVSQWIIDSSYPGLCGDDGLVTQFVGNGCFNVVGHISRGCWLATIAAVCQWYSIWFTLRTAKDIGIHGIEY